MTRVAFWFRRDLRVFANEALVAALENGARDALYVLCPGQWQAHDMAPVQRDLIYRRLNEIGHTLAGYGVMLHILEAENYTDAPQVVSSFCRGKEIDTLYLNDEYEVNEQKRDNACRHAGLTLVTFDGDLLAPPGTVTTGSGEMFKVFTPFKKAWLRRYENQTLTLPGWPLAPSPVPWQAPKSIESTGLSAKWPADDAALERVIARFIDEKLTDYASTRDFPALKGTSGLSPYLALGIVSVKQLLCRIQARIPDILMRSEAPEFSWINELIWREFYRHLIVAWPALCRHENFNRKYDTLPWRSSDADFAAWCEGRTGYPLVDAAMRQLVSTGWMHNRLRMVVASFLTKHLLVDWRKGEKFFMQHLIDGDFASNNGGWQWAASTGCDAQPYFRIFNPISQSEKFDPHGEFIRKYLPELKNVPDKQIHFPHKYLADSGSKVYWAPLVDHGTARQRALAVFKGE